MYLLLAYPDTGCALGQDRHLFNDTHVPGNHICGCVFSLFTTWCCLASLSKQIGHRFAMILFSDLVEQA